MDHNEGPVASTSALPPTPTVEAAAASATSPGDDQHVTPPGSPTGTTTMHLAAVTVDDETLPRYVRFNFLHLYFVNKQ